MPDDNTFSKVTYRAPLHVIPEFGRKHDPYDMCWCNPTKETHDPHTGKAHGAPLYIHKPEN